MKYTLKCPHCGATLKVPEEYKNDKRLHCSQCNQNFDNTLKPNEKKPAITEQQKQQTETTGWTKEQKRGMWVLAFIVCVILYHCGAFNSTGTTPQIGDRVVVTANTWGAVDEAAIDEMGSAIAADDHIALSQLTQAGKVKHIWEGATGKMIHGSWTKVQIRFDDGSAYWIVTEHVKKE